MRMFVSVNLNRQIQTELADIQHRLGKDVQGVRWVKEELLHITLRFLGETKHGAIPAIAGALDKAGEKIHPFTLSFSGIGAFPVLKRPRVIWIGVEEGVSELTSLAGEVDNAMGTTAAVHTEKKNFSFTPHLTVGRVKKNEHAYFSPAILARKWQCATTLQVECFYLMESILFPGGPVYRPVQKFLLK